MLVAVIAAAIRSGTHALGILSLLFHMTALPAGPVGPWLALGLAALSLLWAGRCLAAVLLTSASERVRWLAAVVLALVLQNLSVLVLSHWRAVAEGPLVVVAVLLALVVSPAGLHAGAARLGLSPEGPGRAERPSALGKGPLAGADGTRAWGAWLPVLLAALAAGGWYVLVLLVGLKLPEVGWDALAQHGAAAAAWLQHGGVYPIRSDDYWLNVYPMNTEVGILWQIAILHRDNLLSLSQVPYALLGGLATYVLARGWGAGRAGAALAGLCFLLVPNVIVQARTAYVDLAFGALFLSALALWDGARAVGRPGRWLVFGLALGLLAGTKSTGLLYGGALGVAALLWPQVPFAWRSTGLARRLCARQRGAALARGPASRGGEIMAGAVASGELSMAEAVEPAHDAGAADGAGMEARARVAPLVEPGRICTGLESLAVAGSELPLIRRSGPAVTARTTTGAPGPGATGDDAGRAIHWGLRLVLCLGPAAALGLWWYLRTWVTYGDPVYPFPVSLLGRVLWHGPMSLGQLMDASWPVPYRGRSDLYMLSLAWLGRQVDRWYGSAQGWLGVAWPCVELPALALWAFWGARRAGAWAVLGVVAFVFYLQPHNWDPRYTLWLPAIGAAALVALGLARRPRGVAHLLLALLVIGGSVAAAPRLLFMVPAGSALPAARRQSGALYGAADYGWTATDLHADDRVGYANGPTLLLPLFGTRFERAVISVAAPTRAAFLQRLHAEAISVFVTQIDPPDTDPYQVWMRRVAAKPLNSGPLVYAWRLRAP